MTDNDIIKALECCKSSNTFIDCNECPYVECLTDKGCLGELLTHTLDLIKRQKAEIERLSDKCESVFLSHDEEIGQAKKQARAEAITEFAERLKDDRDKIFTTVYSNYHFGKEIDQIAKEMKGEQE